MANQAVRVPEPSVESSASGVHWGAITAGALGAVGITFVLISLGPALGHVTVSPWSPSGSAPAALGIAAGIWLIVTQWLASGLGGYLAGRLREKWVGIRTDEVLFRDTAHGFLAWALATIIVVALRSSVRRWLGLWRQRPLRQPLQFRRAGSKGSDQLLFLSL